jgi:hypothetical protein
MSHRIGEAFLKERIALPLSHNENRSSKRTGNSGVADPTHAADGRVPNAINNHNFFSQRNLHEDEEAQ